MFVRLFCSSSGVRIRNSSEFKLPHMYVACVMCAIYTGRRCISVKNRQTRAGCLTYALTPGKCLESPPRPMLTGSTTQANESPIEDIHFTRGRSMHSKSRKLDDRHCCTIALRTEYEGWHRRGSAGVVRMVMDICVPASMTESSLAGNEGGVPFHTAVPLRTSKNSGGKL